MTQLFFVPSAFHHHNLGFIILSGGRLLGPETAGLTPLLIYTCTCRVIGRDVGLAECGLECEEMQGARGSRGGHRGSLCAAGGRNIRRLVGIDGCVGGCPVEAGYWTRWERRWAAVEARLGWDWGWVGDNPGAGGGTRGDGDVSTCM